MKEDESLGIFGGTFENEEAVSSYKDALLKQYEPSKKRFKILVDCEMNCVWYYAERL